MEPDESDLLDLVDESVLVRGLDGRIHGWNRACEALYGRSRAQAVGQLIEDVLKTEYPSPLRDIEATTIEAGRWQGEVRRRNASGVEIIVFARWLLRRDASGAPVAIVETGRDVTERKRAQEALRYSEHRYRNLFSAMTASFWELDFSGVDSILRTLHRSGVKDFARHLGENPGIVREMMRATRVIDVNDHTVALFGRGDREELLGNVEPFWPEESTQIFAAGILAAVARKPHYSAECKLRRIDGATFDALFTAAYPPETMGKGSLVIGVIDITERKKSEEALRASEYRYRNMFQAMAASFWELDLSAVNNMVRTLMKSGVTDLRHHLGENPSFVREMMRQTRIIDVNEQTVGLFGAGDKTAFLGGVEPFWPEESAHIYAEAYLQAVERRPNFSTECSMRRIDGGLVDVLFTVTYPRDKSGNTTVFGIIDVTARKQSERALLASEQRYQNLFRAMAVAFWEVDFTDVRALLSAWRGAGVTDFRRHFRDNPTSVRDVMRATRIVDVNDQTVALFAGGSKEALLGTTEPLWPEQSWPVYAEAILSALDGKPSFSVDTPLSRLDGSTFDAHFTVWYSAEDRSHGLAGVIDISERVRAQAMLSQVQADFAHAARVSMLGELTASIAHEVNQPLAAIATNGEAGLRWLARPEPDVAEVRELTKHVVADARRAADIIARIRAMVERRAPEHAVLSIDDVVREALAFLRHEARSRGVTLAHHPLEGAPKVLADRTQLQQVVVNLAVNAMQAMTQSPERRLVFHTTLDGGSVVCAIEDSGPGIPADNLGRLFESFFTTKDGGMGMGLPICRTIIEAHGGRIKAANGVAGGARFTFTLPAAG
jgi:PAS domain S-box-containing protein